MAGVVVPPAVLQVGDGQGGGPATAPARACGGSARGSGPARTPAPPGRRSGAGRDRAAGERTKDRTIRTAQSSVSPTAVTWKLLATATCRAFGELPGDQVALGGRGDRVELAAEHEHRDAG